MNCLLCLQSGSAVSDWALIIDKYRAQNTSRVFAQHLGCSYDSSWRIVDCMKRRNVGEIANAEFQVNYSFIKFFK